MLSRFSKCRCVSSGVLTDLIDGATTVHFEVGDVYWKWIVPAVGDFYFNERGEVIDPIDNKFEVIDEPVRISKGFLNGLAVMLPRNTVFTGECSLVLLGEVEEASAIELVTYGHDTSESFSKNNIRVVKGELAWNSIPMIINQNSHEMTLGFSDIATYETPTSSLSKPPTK